MSAVWSSALFLILICSSRLLLCEAGLRSLDRRDVASWSISRNSEIHDDYHRSPLSSDSPIREKREATDNKPSSQMYSLSIISNIKYRYAETIISSRLANPANESREISFTVTLPESAFISKFLMIVKDKVYEAYVKEKEEAKKDYQAAVEQGQFAGHVEMSARDSNVFTVSVNVEAQDKVTFNLTYEQLLKRMLGKYENAISMNPGQIVKYLSVVVNIEESSNIVTLEVPDLKTSNEIDDSTTENKQAIIERPAENKAKITWNPTVEQQAQISESGPNGQFIVRYDVDRISHPSQILLDEGYFVHFYAPTDLKTLRKHVIFTLDVSGSMQGRKIEQLKEALLQILGDIGENDFFTIVLFSDSVQLWTLNGTYGETVSRWMYNEESTTTTTTTVAPPEDELNEKFIIPATSANVAKAKEFAKTLNDTGGTNIIAALRKSLEISKWGQKHKAEGAEPLIIFLTDGQPNVELSDTEEIIKAVRKQNKEKYALFSLALGDGIDYNFLRKLSLSNNGFARNIYLATDTALQLKNFYKQVASPLLSHVSFEYVPGQLEENSTTREKFNNLFAGSELVVAGKLADGVTSISGNITGVDDKLAVCYFPMPPIEILPSPPEVTAVNKTYGHLEKLWAYLYIQELLDQDAVSDEKNSTYKQKALNLSLKYSFVTPLTSLVVVKPNETVSQNPGKVSDTGLEHLPSIIPIRLSQGPMYAAPASIHSSSVGLYGEQPLQFYAPSPIQPHYNPQGMILYSATIKRGSHLTAYASPSQFQRVTGGIDHSYEDEGDALIAASFDAVDLMQAQFEPPVQAHSTTIIITELYEPTPTPSPLHLNLTDIVWLNGTTEVKYPSSNITYSVAPSDLPNAAYQICLLPNKTQAHCRHLAHCVLSDITASFEDFIPYGEQCVIDARFVGICCPDLTPSSESTPTFQPTSVDLGSTVHTTNVNP